ncbi:MAG: ABC transporter ATP-binding protein [Rhodobacter sp.]|uniref:ABC transporter ATP-binding protein n=1 Tax=Pararhodobacter sp. TaxID=2127056 RepID=UPI001E13E380|nr:ABC transporter ATP-binding protein [Pararhodobacter sp.]MCB1343876.1 ABC transporter ATP-binding protein [Paracoccaceae bacterium]MCC0073313.1 ABC transporter ATP-binding protein [Rhodobacter sp.]HPD91216.1 ABC transporter ATP-binding protein [Pararhodobacter sp.]
MTPEIEITGLGKVFGQGAAAFRALSDIDLTIGTGEFFTLLGPSGCGKTTLLRMIAGFEAPTSGRLRINGDEMAGKGPNARPVNTVFQNYALFPHMTVAQNIGFGLKMLGRPRAEVAATVAEMLRLVRMEPMAGRRPSEISGGQQQRVALARALAPRPRVLLLDEPLSALDLKLRKEMQSELKRLQSETGITFVFVTHDQEEALTMSDRIAVMSAGRILQLGTPHDIYHAPADRFVADFIGDTNFLTLTVVALGDGRATLTLPGGQTAEARLPEGLVPALGQSVTAILRPEQATLADPPGAAMTATVQSAVFFGTDTHLHLTLGDGQPFVLRRQNTADLPVPAPGSTVGLALGTGALRVLRA